MYYKIWSKDPTHIWNYIAFNQFANGSFVKYTMKNEFAVDYVIYKSDNPIEERIFNKRDLSYTVLNENELNNYIDSNLKM